MSNIIRYPVSVVDHKAITKAPLQDDVNELKNFRDEQLTVVPDNVIQGIREIEDFLANTPDTETLQNLLHTLTTSLNTAIAAKYSKPSNGIPASDLATDVQDSLNKANSALQSHQDISGKADTAYVDDMQVYKDVYIGGGETSEDVTVAANHHDSIRKGGTTEISLNGIKLIVVLPLSYSPVLAIEGIVIPTATLDNITIDDTSYKVLRSINTYTGTFNLQIF